jgi:putative two-component system response regulator
VRPIIRHHHEQLDGNGYPDGLKGRSVPLLAQITSVVDVFDAITTDRPYRRARPVWSALECLHADAAQGRRDRAVIDEFAAMIQETSPALPFEADTLPPSVTGESHRVEHRG